MEKKLLIKLEFTLANENGWPGVKTFEIEIPHSKIKNGVTTEEIVVEGEQVILKRIPAGTNVIQLPGLVAFDADNYREIQQAKDSAWRAELEAQKAIFGYNHTLYDLYGDWEDHPLQEAAIKLDEKIRKAIL